MTTSFITSDDCAITRALERATINAREAGGRIVTNSDNTILCVTPSSLADKVMGMYAHPSTKYGNTWDLQPGDKFTVGGRKVLEPQDFEYELTIPD